MNPTTESRLWLQIRQDNLTAQHALVTGHLGLAYALAKKHAQPGARQREQLDELVAEGQVALCEGVETYLRDEPACRFSTYVHRRIEASMISYLRTDGTVIKTEWQARITKAARDHYSTLSRELGRAPTEDEFAYVFGKRSAEQLNAEFHYVDIDDVANDPALTTAHEEAKGDGFDKVPLTSRVVITALAEGATLGEVAHEYGMEREALIGRLWDAAKTMEII